MEEATTLVGRYISGRNVPSLEHRFIRQARMLTWKENISCSGRNVSEDSLVMNKQEMRVVVYTKGGWMLTVVLRVD